MNPNESHALHRRPIHFFNGPLSTNVSLNRFLIKWRDTDTGNEQALGDLSPPEDASRPIANNKPELYFRIAWDKESGSFLLYFCLPLKIRAANKGIRDFYLVVPAESLRRPDGLTLLDDERLDASKELSSLRITLHGPSAVLMPTAGAKRPLSTQARGLLLALKSLSHAHQFEVTFPRSRGGVEDILRDAEALVRGVDGEHGECSSLRSPQIDFEKTFSGREWGENQWDRYSLADGERLQGEWNPLVQEAPPRYEDVIAEDAGCGAERGDGQEDGQRLEDREQAGEEAQLRGEKGKGALLDTSPPRPPPQVGVKEKGVLLETANAPQPPLLPTTSNAQGPTRHLETNRPALLKRKAASSPPRTHAKTGPTAPSPTPLPTSLLLSTLHAHLSPASPPGSLSNFLPLPANSQSVLHLGRSRSLFTDAQYARFFNGVVWLATLWPRRPDALSTLLPHAGRMMQCVRAADWDRFAEMRVAAMAAALGGHGRGESGAERNQEARRPEEKRRRKTTTGGSRLGDVNPLAVPPTQAGAALVGFVYARIGEGADTFIVDDLLALQEVAVLLERAAAAAGLRSAETATQCGQGERGGISLEHASDDAVEEFERQAVSFTFQIAACVMLALYKAHEKDWFTPDCGQDGVMVS